MVVLASLIVPAFIVWGVGSAVRTKKSDVCIGSIFGKKISFEKYLESWQVSKQFAQNQYGENIDSEKIDELAWNRLILLEEVQQRNITVTDKELAQVITSLPQFQRNGAFDPRYYQQRLGHRLTKFEQQMKEDIAIAKLRNDVISEVVVEDEEVLAEYTKERRQAALSVIVIDPAQYESEIAVSDAALEKYYEEHKEAFKTADQISIRYIEILLSDIEKTVEIPDKDIEAYYEANLEEYGEEVVDTLVLPEGGSASPDVAGDAAETEGPKSKTVIKYRNLEEVKDEIREELKQEVLQAAVATTVRRVEDNLYEYFDLEKVAHDFSFTIQETGYFSENQPIPDIGFSQPIAKAAFALEVVGDVSELVKTPEGYYILQLKDKKESYIPPFQEAKESVKAQYLREQSLLRAEKKAEELRTQIQDSIQNGGKTLEETASILGYEVQKTELFTLSGYIPYIGFSPETSALIANLALNEIAPVISNQQGSFIIRLDELQDVDKELFAQQKEGFREKMVIRKQSEYYQKWFEELKEKANLTLAELDSEETRY